VGRQRERRSDLAAQELDFEVFARPDLLRRAVVLGTQDRSWRPTAEELRLLEPRDVLACAPGPTEPVTRILNCGT
jgi:hypothetical protein